MDENITLHIFVDGGARGNPGPSAIGVVVKDAKGKILHEFGKTIGYGTNNVAEYMGVLSALGWLKEFTQKATSVKFFLDSKLVVYQLSGIYKVKDAKLRELLLDVRILEQEVGGNISYTHIPREKNSESDRLVNLALDSKI